MKNLLSLKWVMLIVLALIWGSSFILMKQGLKGFPPEQVAAIRMVIACIASSLFAIRRFKNLKISSIKYMAIVGAVGSGIPALLFAFAQTKLSSYLAGMLNALTPLFTMLLGVLFFRSKFNSQQIIGVLIGFIGAAGLVFIRSGGGITGEVTAAILIVIATCCYGLSVNVIKSFLMDQDALLISAISLIIVGIPYGIFLSTTDFYVRLFDVPEAKLAFLSLATLSIFGTAFASILYFSLVKSAGPLFASAVTYLMPVIALSWGIADGEILNPLHIVALFAILAGVALISWKGELQVENLFKRLKDKEH
ncbi:MAG: EamA family transporter [Bacteroidetes bacterium]|nr:EamA family transporter [Bacteroidota bacterium]